jgi:hypothetical protein
MCQLPISAGAHFISFQIQKLIGRNLIRKNVPMQAEHDREYDTMKNNIVFPYKMNQFGVFVFPIRLPVFTADQRPLLVALI